MSIKVLTDIRMTFQDCYISFKLLPKVWEKLEKWFKYHVKALTIKIFV